MLKAIAHSKILSKPKKTIEVESNTKYRTPNIVNFENLKDKDLNYIMKGKSTNKSGKLSSLKRNYVSGKDVRSSSGEDQKDNSTVESHGTDESDNEERKIRFVDTKMRLCLIDIIKKMKKANQAVGKDNPMYSSFEFIAKQHPLLQLLDVELAKYLISNSEIKLLKQTHRLYYDGDTKTKSDLIYIILFGRFGLIKEINGKKRIISTIKIGKKQ